MKSRLYFLAIWPIWLLPVYTLAQQTISGTIIDENSEPIPSVMIKVYEDKQQRLLGYAMSETDGRFRVKFKETQNSLRVEFNAIGFAPVVRRLDSPADDMHSIIMKEDESILKEVTVKAPTVRKNGDTISYNVRQIKGITDKTIEDVIKKLPGVEVKESGAIYYNDKPINKFYIEGTDMLGGHYTIASQNILADDIATVSVYENHQPIQALKGIEVSNRAALDLTLKRDRKLKPIGTVTAGSGYGDETLIRGEAVGLLIASQKQAIITAKGNNTANLYEGEMTNHHNDVAQTPYAHNILRPIQTQESQIPRSRSTANRTAASTFNTSHKLAEDVQLILTAGYHYNWLSNKQEKTTTYWQGDTENITLNEKSYSHSHTHNGWIRLKLESNKKNIYVMDELNVEGMFQTYNDKLSSPEVINQNVASKNYNINNTFNSTWRKGKRAYNVTSYLSFSNVPQSFLKANYVNKDSFLVYQNVDGTKFHTKESTSHKWTIGAHTVLSINAAFIADYDRLGAGFTLNQERGNNLCEGYSLQTTLYPSLELPQGKFSGRIDMLVQMNDLHYKDGLTNQHFRYDKPHAGVRANFTYRLSNFTRLQFEGSSSRQLGTMMNFVQHPIYTTYRTRTTFGNGILDYKNKIGSGIGLTYSNVLIGVHASINANYQHSRSNTISGSYISPDKTALQQIASYNTLDIINLRGRISRNFYDINTVASVTTTASLTRTQIMRQGVICKTGNDIYGIDANIQSTLADRHLVLESACLYTLTSQNIKSFTKETKLLSNITPSVGITILPTAHWSIYIHANGSFIQKEKRESDEKKYICSVFMDAGTKYKWKKLELDISARNLTNRHEYELHVFDLCDIYNYTYHLRPLEATTTIKWTF